MYKSLSHFIEVLESAGELARVKEFVSPRLEITEIADRFVKNRGKALLFENNGTEFPLLILAFAGDRRLNLAFGADYLEDIPGMTDRLLKEISSPHDGLLNKLKLLSTFQELSSWMPRSISPKSAPCQEVVMNEPDINALPVLTCWPHDGGPFITLPCVHTIDPETGIRNLGMYRLQVFGKDLCGMHWHMHKGSASHFAKYRKLGRRMPVTVTLGGDPVYTYSATAPLPENFDEYLLAGFLRKKKVELVRCLTNSLEVPADADIVIEGFIDPSEDLILEGPFGDHTGFYSLPGYFPRFHVSCITHRKNAVYPATIVGIPPQEDAWIGKATETFFLPLIRISTAPEITGMHMPAEGVFHNLALVSIQKHYPGQAVKVMNSLWGAGQMMFNKIMAVTDDETSLHDYLSLARKISVMTDPVHDIHFIDGPVDILDHSSRKYALGSKMGIDATFKGSDERTETKSLLIQDIDKEVLRLQFPEIKAANTGLLKQGISLLILCVEKARKGHLKELSQSLLQNRLLGSVRFILYADSAIDPEDLSLLAWYVANNLDPVRDCFYLENERKEKYPALFIDGTRKSEELDGFSRDWPNVITMDEKTIMDVDARWDRLNIGAYLPSPSRKFKSLVISNGAIAGSCGRPKNN